jgi:hypothetical protein
VGGAAAGAGGWADSARTGSGSLDAVGAAELCWADAVGAGAENADAVEGADAVRCGPVCVGGATAESTGSRRTANTALHTVQRARTPASGTFAGSTRYTVAQFGQVTFIS